MLARMFTPATMLKHWSLIPVVASCAAGTVMCAAYVGYMCGYKRDLSWTPGKYSVKPPYGDVEPTSTIRLYGYTRVPNLAPDEIHTLRRELNEVMKSE